jgi:CYTH domain-containing protein
VHGGSLDVYEYPEPGLRVFEIEFTNPEEAAAYAPPALVGKEVTNESRFSGFALARSEA